MHAFKVFLSIIQFITLFPFVISATTWDRDQIESFAKNHLEEQISPPAGGKISINITNLDPRIVIQPCQKPLSANIPENIHRRNVIVKVTCDDPSPWQLYIPAKIERTYAVVVALSTIEKGATLTEQNIGIKYLESNSFSGEKINEIEAVLGSKAKRRIGKKRPITRKNVCLVCKGDAVTIIVQNENFQIKSKGIALSSGNINQQIKVKNTRSGRVITPKISAINQVTINL